MKEKPEQNNELRDAILKSPASKSLLLETFVYDAFKKLGWEVTHSPYYIDKNTEKLREIDITARKLFHSKVVKDVSCDLVFIIECKSLKDYHVIVSNKADEYAGKSLIELQLSDDSYNGYRRIEGLLKKYAFRQEDIKQILEILDQTSFPTGLNFFNNYRPLALELPTYNTFRETNIGTTKDLENSVVWRAFQGITSCIEKYKEMDWQNLETTFIIDQFEKPQYDLKEVLELIKITSKHVKFIHPLIVLESNLWELDGDSINSLKYLRLVFHKIYEDDIWVDIVNKDHLEDYLSKTEEYDNFLNSVKFEL